MEESRKETGVAEAAPSLDTEEVADMRVKSRSTRGAWIEIPGSL